MTLSAAWLDELRARTLLSSLIGRTTKVTKAGREWKACCPFHNEKTPSFTINDEKGFYHCFGCGAHGDAIRWMTDQRGLPFMDAVKELAEAAGLEVPAPDPRAAERAERLSGLYAVMEDARAWFQDNLWGVDGGEARASLEKRGIDADFARRMGLGWAPRDKQRLRRALDRHSDEVLTEAGLLISIEGKEPYARFRGRLIMPIRDIRSRVIALGGRIVGDGEPKYLNSPQTPLFDKGRSLFNVEIASPASRKSKRLVIVEGYMDCYACMRAGAEDVVAPNGTAMTEQQMMTAWRMADVPIICLDGDRAGYEAAAKAAIRSLPGLSPGKSFRFAFPPPGKDPDDVVREGGRAGLDKMLEAAVPLVEVLWRHELASGPTETPEDRAALKSRLREHCQNIADPMVREEYFQEFRRRLDERFGSTAAKSPRNAGWRPTTATSGTVKDLAKHGLQVQLERALVAGLALHPRVVAAHLETVGLLDIHDRECAEVRDTLIERVSGGLVSADHDLAAPLLRQSHLMMPFLGRTSSEADVGALVQMITQKAGAR